MGDGCYWYDDNPEMCGYYDDDDFSAFTMCCACEGRTMLYPELNLASTAKTNTKLPVVNLSNCLDTDFTTDLTGDGCSWYTEFSHTCGDYDDDDFSAATDCCACGGGFRWEDPTDSAGDGCDWYVDNTAWSGSFDDDDFVAADLCPACWFTYAVLQGIKEPHPMINLQRGAFPLSLAGSKKIPLNMQIDEMD